MVSLSSRISPADFHRDLAREVAVRDRSCHLGDVANLGGQVARHQVHRIGEIFPDARNTFHLRLTAELAFRAHFARHASDFECEGFELVHHRVDGVLQLENLALRR